jgi:hypothetical protein
MNFFFLTTSKKFLLADVKSFDLKKCLLNLSYFLKSSLIYVKISFTQFEASQVFQKIIYLKPIFTQLSSDFYVPHYYLFRDHLPPPPLRLLTLKKILSFTFRFIN